MSSLSFTPKTKVHWLFIIMGVSGSGKSSLSKYIAEKHGFVFVDADDFHNKEAKKHMAENRPLTDQMRAPWIASILSHLNTLYQKDKSVVLAYSGLKVAHRQLFRELKFNHHFFCLAGNKTTITERINQREEHFFSSTLLDSQFESLELPVEGEKNIQLIDIEWPFPQVANEINHLVNQLIGKE